MVFKRTIPQDAANPASKQKAHFAARAAERFNVDGQFVARPPRLTGLFPIPRRCKHIIFPLSLIVRQKVLAKMGLFSVRKLP